jgi:hypothetical protein
VVAGLRQDAQVRQALEQRAREQRALAIGDRGVETAECVGLPKGALKMATSARSRKRRTPSVPS